MRLARLYGRAVMILRAAVDVSEVAPYVGGAVGALIVLRWVWTERREIAEDIRSALEVVVPLGLIVGAIYALFALDIVKW